VGTAGSGIAVSPSLAAAALDAATAAMERGGLSHGQLALVFLSILGGDAPKAAHEILHIVRRVTGARTVVGCSGVGVLTEQREIEGQSAAAVLVIQDDRLVASPVSIESLNRDDVELAREIADSAEATLAEGGSLLLLPDPRGFDPKALLGGLAEAIGPVPVLGGVAAGTAEPIELCNTQTLAGGLAGAAICGPVPLIGVAQGCAPIGEPYVVTRAEESVVHQIAGRPALDVLREAMRTVENAEQRIPRAGIFAGLAMDSAKSPLERGDFLVRNLLGVDPRSGAIAVAERVRVGQTIQFQLRDAQASREDLQVTLASLRARLGGRRPVFGCYFNCAGRGQGLYGEPDCDVTSIREALGEFPLAGFFGNGELAPVGRQNFLHTYTGVLVLIPEDLGAA
jgi:small ligand-binding sensory domain FIST